jgi:hypothetical protein
MSAYIHVRFRPAQPQDAPPGDIDDLIYGDIGTIPSER